MELEPHIPRTEAKLILDFNGRRTGIVDALTIDFQKFHEQCDPDGIVLCLYGHPDKTWEVKSIFNSAPLHLPEPTEGINFSRDEMITINWIKMIALHSDSWLLAVVFYFAGRIGFDKLDRSSLFELVNTIPTVYEEVTQLYERHSRKGNPASSSEPQQSNASNDLCAACGLASTNKTWVQCDKCEKWFHCKCVGTTIATARLKERYECPICRNMKYKVTRVS